MKIKTLGSSIVLATLLFSGCVNSQPTPSSAPNFDTVFKEKVAFVGWNHDADFIPMLNNVGRPAKQVLPVFTSGLAKNVLPVASGDHINPIPGLLVLRFMIKSDDV